MSWPPYLLKLRIKNRRHSFAFWIPLFILGPIFLVFVLALCLSALPFVLLSLLFTWRWTWWSTVFFSVPAFVRILCSLPGTRISVEERDQQIVIAFF
jgi:hypothetical protein